MRGFKKAKGYEIFEFDFPKRSTKFSAGYDIKLLDDLIIEPGAIELGVTGLKAFMMDDEVLKLYPRSSLSRRLSVTIPNNVGIIDKDYFGNPVNDGAIFVALWNFGTESVHIKKGERVAQGIFQKYLVCPDEAEIKVTRSGGFGSTGK